MSEVSEEVLEVKETQAIKPIVGVGKAVKADKIRVAENVAPEVKKVAEIEDEDTDSEVKEDEHKPDDVPEVKSEKSELTPERKKELMKELFGDDEIDIDAIRESLKKTPEEKQKDQSAESARELSVIKFFVDNEGTMDQWEAVKKLAKTDLLELSKSQATEDIIKQGFSKTEAEEILASAFYQIDLNEIEQDFGNESDEEFAERVEKLKKMKELGSKMLESYSADKQKQANNIIKQLEAAVDAAELQAKEDAQISSNVDDVLKNFSRSTTIQLGKVNDLEINPVDHVYSEKSFKAVADLLKDPIQRNNLFKKGDGTLDVPKLTELLLINLEYKRLVKTGLLEGQSRTTSIYDNTFPFSSPQRLGVGGGTSRLDKNSIVSVGKPQRQSRQQNN